MTFTAIGSQGTTTPVTFGDIPTVRQIADVNALSLPSNFVDGAVTISGPPCAQPSFLPVAGTYSSAQSVTISTTTSGATINYTTDGTTPSETAGTVYTTPVTISQNTNLQAIAYASGFADSSIASGYYSIQCAAPTFSPAAGTYASAQSVTIGTATSGATICYTTDGTTPSETSGTIYTTPVTISQNTTLQAIAYESGMTDSTITSAAYTIIVQCAAPTFNPAAGTYGSAQSVTISTTTSGATISYTTDGTTPSETSGTIYTTPVAINQNTTLQAIAYESGIPDSLITSGNYYIQCAAPTFSPAAGTYGSVQSVTISTTTSGATIHYTTDGTTPSETTGTVYATPVTISQNTNLQAITYESGFADSPITNGNYGIQCAAPTFSPAAGTYNAVQSVTISTATSGATISYTTDGTTPSETSGTIYTTPVAISQNTTLQAIAYGGGMADSPLASGMYTIQLPLTAVALAATPASPQPLNTPITLTATPTGGSGQVQYLFRVGYVDSAGWHWTNLTADYTTTASCTWTPTSVGVYTLVVWARLIGHTANYDQFGVISYQVTLQPFTAVALAVTPASPQQLNTAVTLTATPTGGSGQVQYLFRVGYVDTAGWHWTNINNTYSSTSSCTWTPTTTGAYTLVVWARVIGHTTNYDQYAMISYQVTPTALKAVVLSATPASPQLVNTPITLNAIPTGGNGQVQYLFRVGYTDSAGWHWTNLNANYTTTASCTWTPASVRAYTLVVWARIIGHTASYDQYGMISYQVAPPSLTAVALAAQPASTQAINTPVTLTATPTGGGGQVQYLFRVGYLDSMGWHWTNLNANYTTTASCSWTPTSLGTYTLVVWARIIGHTASYDRYASINYQVTLQPLTAVTLAVKPASPQPVNTPVTLTASSTGGSGQVQYLFRVGYADSAGWHWTNLNANYTTIASCTWSPTAAGAYTLVVWARLIGHTANYDQYGETSYQVLAE